jgi:hypothetical protein
MIYAFGVFGYGIKGILEHQPEGLIYHAVLTDEHRISYLWDKKYIMPRSGISFNFIYGLWGTVYNDINLRFMIYASA